MKYKMKYSFLLLLITISAYTYGQNAVGDTSGTIAPIIADSLESGNYKDVLTSFFQLAYNDITGPGKEVAFDANVFAILAKGNKNLLIDSNYVKYNHLRNLNINFSVKLDSTYHPNGFSFGFKYALINGRDYTISRYYLAQLAKNAGEENKLTDLIATYVRARTSALNADPAQISFIDSFMVQPIRWLTDTTYSYVFSSMDKNVQDTLYSIISDTGNHLPNLLKLIKGNKNISARQELDKRKSDLLNDFQNNPLWTINANSTFLPNAASNNKMALNSLTLYSEFLKGMSKTSSASIKSEFDVLAAYTFTNDSMQVQNNLMRNIFTFQPGVNFYLNTKNTGKSCLEFKLSGTYYHTFSTLMPGQKADSSTINADIRVRIINDLWLPISIKYDPQTGNVFGLLNVKCNFTGMKNALKSLYTKNNN